MDTTINQTPTIHLQAIGRVAAKPAGELQVGDVIKWNFGYLSPVIKIEPRGKMMITVYTQSNDGDTVYMRAMNKTRLVAVKGL